MRIIKGISIFIIGFVVALTTQVPLSLAASEYPNRYIEVIVPYPPGGPSDIASKMFKEPVEKILGQPMVLVYKPGSAGVVGSMYVKGAKPDGYTLLLASTSILILPPLTKKAANYHIEDFAPICTLTSAPGVLCVSKSSPYKSLNEFVQAGKTKRMTYSTPGAISGNHLTMEAFVRAAKIEATHVPAAGGAAAQTAVLGGHVDMSCSAPTGMENQLRILSVAQEKRWELHPEVPSLGEQGYSVRSSAIYFSLVAPKGTPKEITDKLYSAHKKVLEENKEAINKIARAANSSAVVLNPDELLKIYLGNNDFYEGTLKKMGVTIKD